MPNQHTSTSNRGRNNGRQDEDEDDDRQTNGQGRVKDPEHDGRLKQNRDTDTNHDDDNHENNKGTGRQAGRGTQGGQQATPAVQKRVLSRAVRVLNEIETRIHELREELEEKFGDLGGTSRTGGTKPGGQSQGRSRNQSPHDDDDNNDGEEEVQPHGQGRVKHPESDRRLKQNRDD